jgi:hypothetical protein
MAAPPTLQILSKLSIPLQSFFPESASAFISILFVDNRVLFSQQKVYRLVIVKVDVLGFSFSAVLLYLGFDLHIRMCSFALNVFEKLVLVIYSITSNVDIDWYLEQQWKHLKCNTLTVLFEVQYHFSDVFFNAFDPQRLQYSVDNRQTLHGCSFVIKQKVSDNFA